LTIGTQISIILIMKSINWNKEKNKTLKKNRKITFEIVSLLIETKQTLEIIKHPDQERYPDQKIFVVEYKNYAYLIPFVENDEEVFLKTIIPSRKATRKYLRGKKNG